MAVASDTKDKIEPPMDSFPSPPSKPDSDSGSESALIPGDLNDQSDSASSSQRKDVQFSASSSSPQRKEKDVDVLLSPAYLKSEEYRLLFRLPPEEVLVQDFNCAFQESILLQGHMYLFVRHICFYSNIFGFETKKTIPLQEVTCVRKAKTAAIFPNAIEIVSWGKKHFFASFLSRDEAYRLIVDGWSQSINGSKVQIDHQDLKSEIRPQDNGHFILEEVKSIQQPIDDVYAVARNEDANVSGECKLISNGEDDVSISTRLLGPEENGELDIEAVVDAECMSSVGPLCWKTEDADAPNVPDYFTKVAESKFPIQVEEFFDLFFSDTARSFTEAFHTKCGDKDFRCSTWRDHEHSREVSFQHPIKIYFGAKFGHCHEVQKFRVYRNSRLVIETSQEISDVPYGDYFRVEGLWVVERDGTETNQSCILRVHVNVVFSKKTMWRGKIEQSTVEECREAYSIWLNNAHACLKQKNLEKLNETGTAPDLIQSSVQLEGDESDKSLSESSHVTRTLPRIPSMVSGSRNENSRLENPAQGDPSIPSFITSLFAESLTRFCLYIRSQIHVPLILVVASISILLLMQLSIIALLTRAPQVHVVAPVDYMNSIASSRGDRAEAVAWLEKQVHHLKDEMSMVEVRLEKMRHEHALLKLHLKALEQLKDA